MVIVCQGTLGAAHLCADAHRHGTSAAPVVCNAARGSCGLPRLWLISRGHTAHRANSEQIHVEYAMYVPILV